MVECGEFEEDFFGDEDVEGRIYSPTHRRITRQHRLLLGRYERASGDWASRALYACLDALATNTWSEAWGVGVIDAWLEDDAAFCVVYRYRDYPHSLGIRRGVNDHDDPYGSGADDPEQFGRGVATSDIGEPLGTVTRALQHDAAGVHWWGRLGDFLPSPPDGHHGTVMPADRPTRTRRVHDLSDVAVEEAVLGEIGCVNDWVSIAAALVPLGSNSWVAGRSEVQRVLACVDASEKLRLGRVSDRFDEIPTPVPIPAILDDIFSQEDRSGRVFAMMELFIAPN